MKRSGILNGRLAAGLALLGHGDLLAVCDAGMPLPRGPEVIDLAVAAGLPGFAPVLRALTAELVLEEATVAEEIIRHNPASYGAIEELVGRPYLVSHEHLKGLFTEARLIVRTGEATPYSNVILRCGVAF